MNKAKIQAFAKSLTKAERRYLWAHVYRYTHEFHNTRKWVHEGVEGTTAKEQFERLIQYTLNFLDGDSRIEKAIFSKAMKQLE